MLGMRLEVESEIVRAYRTRKRLKKEKENTLIILDDLWDGLDLNRLGIPLSEDDSNQHDVKDIADFSYNKMKKEKLSSNFNMLKEDKLSGEYNKIKTEKLYGEYNKIKTEKSSSDHKGCSLIMLDDARKRVQNEVIVAEMNAEEIEDDVKNWLKQVDEKIKEYKSFLCDGCHKKTRCSIGFFPNNLQLRYRLGRKAMKTVEEIKADGLWNKKFDKVSYKVGPSMDVVLSNTGYESFASRNKTMEMIMQALEDSTVSMIGVYGVGGVGKTTLVKEVAKIAKEKKLFNTVVMANITRNPDIKKVQGHIAEMLGMRLEEESEIVRADRIQKRLKKEKENTLIILDDLWDGLDLNRLGIPLSEDDDNQQDVKDIADFGYNKMEKEKLSSNFNMLKEDKLSGEYNKIKTEKFSGDRKGCKILLTSRIKEVLRNQMDVQERSTFSLGVLDKKEAETLLKKVAGIHVTNSAFDEKVIEISRMCAGFPIALISIGRALKNKSPSVWEDICRQIERQNFTGGQESIEFSTKLSYDHLKNEKLKHIFLQCARMGNDFLIMDLVKFCIGLDLLQGVYSIRDTKSRVNVLIEELNESSLLVKSYSNDCFNMHDIVRDVALSISSKEKDVFFMKNGKLNEWPHKDKLQRYTNIVLHYCDIVQLPESIYCPRLEVFHIDSKDDFLKIPDDFFKDMIELRVLILTGVNLSCLPSSIKGLTNLKMLCLERCTLGKNLSIIGELKKLRILTLSGSNIENLPVELGQLDKLQLLDLSNCSKLRVIPSNIISRMNSLEELYMRDDLILWEAEEKIQSENASLSELRHLNELRTLDIHIPSVAHFPQNLFFDKLDSYKIVIGEFDMLSVGEFKIPDKYEVVKFLALNLKDDINIHAEKWIKMLFKRVEHLLLGELNDVRDVFYELNVEGFPNLKHLSIVNNAGIQYIINSMEQFPPLLAFPKLESMCLYKLENLEKICDIQLTEASFCRLKTIKIKACDQLKNIFSFSMLRCLTMLETIEVCDCDSLKEIVSVERESYTVSDMQADKVEFPRLRFLILQSLPAFFCLYTNKMPSFSQSLEDQVPNKELKEITTAAGQDTNACHSLFDGKVSIPKLEWLELSSINTPQIWNEESLYCFQNLLTLNVTDCNQLKYLLSFSIARSLVNLQSLFVSGCELMEAIFSAEEEMKMEINRMEKLNTIWQPHIGFHSFHGLDSLIIRECNKLVTIFPSYTGQGFQSLRSLVIVDCESVETIFALGNIPQTYGRNETNLHDVFLKGLPKLVHVWNVDVDGILNFNNLQSIIVYESKMLKYLFPLSVANDLQKLETLDVCNCWGMKEIVAWDYGSNEEVGTFRFPQLNTLSLQHLFELRSFYPGEHTLEWPLLKKMFILVCSNLEETTNSQVKPIFLATEKVIHNLEYMSISLKEAEWLRDYVVSVHRMHKLQSLVLFGLKNTEILFWLLHRLPNLESITLKNCLFDRIWAPTSLVVHEKIGVVVQLKELIFNNLWYLQNIGFEHDLLLQRVERLVISGCLKLNSLLPSSVSLSYLTYLEVTDCLGLKNLMTSSTAKTLVQLTIMKVSLCKGIVKIVAEEEAQVIEFRQLKAIELVSLHSLTCFCSSEKCDLKFPLLENLVVSDCPLMKTFSKVQSAPNLQKIHVAAGEKDRWYWEGDLNATLQKYVTDKVSLEHAKHLILMNDSELGEIWHSKAASPNNYFHRLKTLVMKDITKDVVIPSQILPCLKSLEELQVDGGAVEVIFDMDDIDTKITKGIVSRLKILTLNELPDLKCVWNKNPQGIVSFSNLQEVIVTDCVSLVTLFPSSLARNVGKLKALQIFRCDKLVEIVGMEDATELGRTEMFEFPCLSWLRFYKLPLLSCFYPGKHHLECPILEYLDVSYCPRLKLLTSKFYSHKEAVIESPIIQLQQPLLSVEKVVPKLKNLSLNEENIILLSDKHLPPNLLCKLNILDLSFEEDDKKKDSLPFDFLHKVPSLKNLVVRRCFGLKEIFPSQVHDGILAGLNKLELVRLKELESIGLEHPWVKPYSEKLERLRLYDCPRLKKLVRCAVSFINLKEMYMLFCPRMEYLFSFSTAKSLVQLEILYIMLCESIKEIVKKEDEDASDDIIFGRLTKLTLQSLPMLVSFYSGNATFEFPCLENATVAECPNMKTFSQGGINAPLFYGIKTSMGDSDSTFHRDLNTTIERLFRQQ
ncbi:putative disease resistance protein, partial [Mucuna pruriens]